MAVDNTTTALSTAATALLDSTPIGPILDTAKMAQSTLSLAIADYVLIGIGIVLALGCLLISQRDNIDAVADKLGAVA